MVRIANALCPMPDTRYVDVYGCCAFELCCCCSQASNTRTRRGHGYRQGRGNTSCRGYNLPAYRWDPYACGIVHDSTAAVRWTKLEEPVRNRPVLSSPRCSPAPVPASRERERLHPARACEVPCTVAIPVRKRIFIVCQLSVYRLLIQSSTHTLD